MNCWSLLTLSQNKLVPKQPKKNGPSPAYFSFIFSLFKQTIQFVKQINAKMSIQYMAPGFLPTTFWSWVVTHNHSTRAPTLKYLSNLDF